VILVHFTDLKSEIANGNQRYWFKYIITTPNQLTAAALVIQYWLPRDKVNPGVWIAIFLVVIIVIVRIFPFLPCLLAFPSVLTTP
jgi:L-asparagine transporter-like permease